MTDFYIPRTKAELITMLRESGIQKPSKLKAMGFNQLLAIYCKKREKKSKG